MTLPVVFDRPDDPLAILRCATSVAQAGALPAPEITLAARDAVGMIPSTSPTAIHAELTRALVAHHVHLALQWLHEVGAMSLLLPELEATVDFSQESGRKHKDVWEHTKQVVRQAVPDPAVRWAALLHDIGKVPTRTFTPDGGVHFHGHAEVGARMFDPISRRFSFERGQRHKVRFLILHHLRANQYAPSWTDSAVRRFDREMSEHLEDLLALSRADITSKRPGAARSCCSRSTSSRRASAPCASSTPASRRCPLASARRSPSASASRRHGASAISSGPSRTPASAATSRNGARTATTWTGSRPAA
jgi:poly(A) polymerase